MAVIWRNGCEACHADAAPLSDVYHDHMHALLEWIDHAKVGDSEERARLESEKQNLWEELLDMERQRDAALDELEELKAKGTKA